MGDCDDDDVVSLAAITGFDDVIIIPSNAVAVDDTPSVRRVIGRRPSIDDASTS
jgi:hypothetical protein